MIPFWQNVKEELSFQNLTQKELANAISESYNTLQTWIKADRYPDAKQAVNIAKTLKTSVEYLVTGKEGKSKAESTRSAEILEQLLTELKEENAKNIDTLEKVIKKLR